MSTKYPRHSTQLPKTHKAIKDLNADQRVTTYPVAKGKCDALAGDAKENQPNYYHIDS